MIMASNIYFITKTYLGSPVVIVLLLLDWTLTMY